ncbi:MAG: DUF1559 domain-containing protein [Planctomycetaceae bacterium]|jgi:prepilin-type N-terminal cleavage/methylation domain-containing protein|nr:DUF1559 domain-containing protein [Planctomycetaceae bacterium]
MKKQLHVGFTLVELLVVISIIGMLAGLLLPAVNAAREAGRRATCVSNQSQAALAIINYDAAKTYLPALRQRLVSKTTGTGDDGTTTEVQVSWVGLILPYMEQTTAWDRLTNWYVAPSEAIFGLTLPSLKCKSDVVEGTRISYVVNGGYQNAVGTWGGIYTGRYNDPARREDAPFFDYLMDTPGAATDPRDKGPTVSLDYISMHNGTSNMILLSENLQAGEWISQGDGTTSDYPVAPASLSVAVPAAQGEAHLAFCYPINDSFASINDWPASKGLVYAYTSSSTIAYSSPDEENTNAHASWKGYNTLAANNPLFINVARVPENFSIASAAPTQYNLARPSSNHPGIVIAVFADRGAKPLNDNMDKKVFVQICQPSSGAIIKSLE